MADPLGIFSAAATIPTIFILSFKLDTNCRVAKVVAAPDISIFISSILAPGLREMPPVSKVTPLPTITVGAFFLPAPLYSRAMSAGMQAMADKNGGDSNPLAGLMSAFTGGSLTNDEKSELRAEERQSRNRRELRKKYREQRRKRQKQIKKQKKQMSKKTPTAKK